MLKQLSDIERRLVNIQFKTHRETSGGCPSGPMGHRGCDGCEQKCLDLQLRDCLASINFLLTTIEQDLGVDYDG